VAMSLISLGTDLCAIIYQPLKVLIYLCRSCQSITRLTNTNI